MASCKRMRRRRCNIRLGALGLRSRHFPVAWGILRRVQLAPRHRHLQRNPQQSDNHHHRLRSPATIPRVHRFVCSSRFITWPRQVCCRRGLHAKQSRPVTRLHGVLGRQHGLRRCNLQTEMPSCKAHKAAARRQKRQPEPVSRVASRLLHATGMRLLCVSSRPHAAAGAWRATRITAGTHSFDALAPIVGAAVFTGAIGVFYVV